MRIGLIAVVLIGLSACQAGAIGDISVGPFFGMSIPVVNDDAESGPLYGIQARVGIFSFVALGVHFQGVNYNDPELAFFQGTPNEFTGQKDGGDATSFGVDAYLGSFTGAPGVKFYLVGSVGSYSWDRSYTDEVSEIMYGVGPGLEFAFPFNLGIEGRGMFEIVPKGNDATYKNVNWFVAVNYHFGLSR